MLYRFCVQILYLLLADLMVIVHALIVFTNVAALPVIWIGSMRHWKFVRGFAFRVAHLALIGFVAAESVIGMVCPLTTWENALRRAAGSEAHYAGGFIAHWAGRLLFYNCPAQVFTAAYVAFFVIVALTWILVRPHPPNWRLRRDAKGCEVAGDR